MRTCIALCFRKNRIEKCFYVQQVVLSFQVKNERRNQVSPTEVAVSKVNEEVFFFFKENINQEIWFQEGKKYI